MMTIFNVTFADSNFCEYSIYAIGMDLERHGAWINGKCISCPIFLFGDVCKNRDGSAEQYNVNHYVSVGFHTFAEQYNMPLCGRTVIAHRGLLR